MYLNITVVTGFVYHRSFFSNPEKVKNFVLDKVANKNLDFHKHEIILSSLSRV